jgi:diaminopimelate decarboxylase
MATSLFGVYDAAELANRWGTPVYVVSLDQLTANVRAASASLGGTRLLYSLKTNYLPAITRHVRALGLGIDVVSGYELQAALDSGFPGERIVFNGPVKHADELAMAVEHGVYVNIDGTGEIEELAALAARRDVPIPVGLRVFPPGDVYADAPGTDRAIPSKFGWPVGDGSADLIADQVIAQRGLRLTGVHCHLGSQVTNAEMLLNVLEPVLAWTAGLRAKTDITRLNIGGGFGVPGIHRVKGAVAGLSRVDPVATGGSPSLAFDLAGFHSGLRGLLAAHGLDDVEVYAEPGRALVSSAALLLTRVTSMKQLRDHAWVILDGGLNLLPTAGVTERHQFTALRPDSASRPAPADVPYLVGGPLCYEGDVFATDVLLPGDLRVGDLVAINDAGAYGFSRATSFNRLRAATVVLEGGTSRLAWRAETYQDLMQMEAD